MRFKKQGWLKDAVATPRGFAHPRTGEILKRVGLEPEEIAEWNDEELKLVVKEQVKVEEELEEFEEEFDDEDLY
jgi:hypothetical protein